MNMLRNEALTALPMDALRRPLTERETRKLRGRGAGARRRDAVAALAQAARSGNRVAAALANVLLRCMIYDEMASRMLKPRTGPVAQLTADIRRAEKLCAEMLR